jgi:hypothetical protein
LGQVAVARLKAGSPAPAAASSNTAGAPKSGDVKEQPGTNSPQPPAPAKLERDTYYVSTADAERMLRLLEVFAPEVQTRDYKKGFIARKGSDEWYFERRENAAEQARTHGASTGAIAANSSEHAHAGTDIGLPAPNVATVEIHGFRGVRQVGERWLQPPKGVQVPPQQKLPAQEAARIERITSQYPLLKYGHIGLSLDGGKTIWGFTPAQPPDMVDAEFLAALGKNRDFPGLVRDDKQIFVLADNYAKNERWNTKVYVATQLVDAAKKKEIETKIAPMSANDGRGEGAGHGKSYQFPNRTADTQGSHFKSEDTANCATFPALVGVPVPEPSGVLQNYMPKLEGWANDSPVDLRTKPSGGAAKT